MNTALKNFLNHKEIPADMFVLNLYDFAHMYEQKICHGRIGAGEYTLRIHLRGTLNVQAIPSYPFRMRWRFEWKSPLNWLNCSRRRNTRLIHSLNHKTGKFHPRKFLIRSRKMSPTANQCSRQTQLCWATRQRKENHSGWWARLLYRRKLKRDEVLRYATQRRLTLWANLWMSCLKGLLPHSSRNALCRLQKGDKAN